MDKQKCLDCKEYFPLTAEYWYKDKRRKSGFNSLCKKCKNKRDKKYYKSKYTPKKLTEYALYDGEEILGIGTAKELAELTGVKEQTIRFYSTNSYKERLAEDSRSLVVVKIEYEEEELWG